MSNCANCRSPSLRTASCSASHRAGLAGFTITELLVSMTILAIIASTITLSVSAFHPTARQEAGKIAFFLSRAMRKADRWHSSFTLTIATNKSSKTKNQILQIQWDGQSSDFLTLSSGFSISSNIRRNQKIRYSSNSFEPASVTLTVKNDYSNSSHSSHLSHLIVINSGMVSTKSPD